MSALPDILEWSRDRGMADSPWLMLGKGPTFRKLPQVETSGYRLLSLNHVVRERPVDIAHAIDLDVVHDCADALRRHAGALWMPAHPHVDCKPSTKPLWQLAEEVPVLGELAREGRLAWYNTPQAPRRFGDSPVVDVKFFSAEAALHALALAGARTVRSLGVDGGDRYDAAFDDLAGTTCLANGHPAFDRQFESFARILQATGVFYAPLTIQAPVRVFVGTDATQRLAYHLLAHSIRRHASVSVAIEPIDDREIPVPKDPAQRARTGFSFSRFRIPELCGYRGRAIYLDADMQVFSDIRRIWTLPFDGAHLLYADSGTGGARQPQYSVMLLDCAALDWNVRTIVGGLDTARYDYAALMQRMCIVDRSRRRAGLPPTWNSLEHFEACATDLLHYTDMQTQPWVSDANRNGALFYRGLREAIDSGAIPRELLDEEVERGHVSPDLPRWIGLAPAPGARAAAAWTPPYRRLIATRVTG